MIGDLTNDPNHDRYSTAQIDEQLENVQNRWNVSAGIIVDSTVLTSVSNQSTYPLSGVAGTPLNFRRVTFSGRELDKRSKVYLDLYSGTDWTLDLGTPTEYYIDTDKDGFNLVLHPTPQDGDAGLNIGVECIVAHTAMALASDSPFNNLTYIAPYHYGVAYEIAALLLVQDPNPANQVKVDRFQRIGNNTLADLVQTFKSFEKEEPMRLAGGRYWKY